MPAEFSLKIITYLYFIYIYIYIYNSPDIKLDRSLIRSTYFHIEKKVIDCPLAAAFNKTYLFIIYIYINVYVCIYIYV